MEENIDLINYSDNSKIWIFAPEKKLGVQETKLLQTKLEDFAINWVSHQNKLKATGFVLYDYFAILVVDNSLYPASGCSMDTLFRFISTLNIEFETDFLNRKLFQYLDKNENLQIITQDELVPALASGAITPETNFFDNLITTLTELKSNWIKPFDQFWISNLV